MLIDIYLSVDTSIVSLFVRSNLSYRFRKLSMLVADCYKTPRYESQEREETINVK